MPLGLRGMVAAAAGMGAASAVSLAAAVVSNVVTSVLAPAPLAGGTSATAPIPSIAITSLSPSPAPAAAGTTGTTGAAAPGNTAADTSFLVALDSASPPMGQPLVLFLMPSQATVSLAGAGCPSTTGCLAPSAGLYGYNGVGSVSGAGDVYAQLGLSGGAGYGVTVPSLSGTGGPTSYLVQAFQVPVNLDPASPIALSAVGAPAGTQVLAYDCASANCATAAATPLANVGTITAGSAGPLAAAAPAGAAPVVVAIPEPRGWALLLLGLTLLAVVGLQRQCLGSGIK